MVRPAQHSQRIGSAKRTTFVADSQSENPGPGGYMLGSTLDSKGFTFQKKYPQKPSDTPGPGTYDPFREDDEIPVAK